MVYIGGARELDVENSPIFQMYPIENCFHSMNCLLRVSNLSSTVRSRPSVAVRVGSKVLRGHERNFINLTQMLDHVQIHTNKLYLDTFPFPFSIFEFNCSTVLKIILFKTV